MTVSVWGLLIALCRRLCSSGQAKGEDVINSVVTDKCLIAITMGQLSTQEDRNSCSLVCKRWHRLSNGARKRLRLISPTHNEAPAPIPTTLFARFPNLERIDLSLAYAHVDDDILFKIAASCHKLQHLDVRFCERLTDNGISAIARGCPDLRAVLLNNSSGVGFEGVSALVRCCKKLRSLEVARCVGMDNKTLSFVGSGCGRTLETLALVRCEAVTDAGLSGIGLGCIGLKQLSLSGCEGVTARGISVVARGCKVLQKLDLSNCRHLGDDALRAIASHCGWLEELKLVGCGAGDAGLQALSTCRRLRHLDVSYCEGLTSVGVAHFVSACKTLRSLHARGLHAVDDNALAAIGENGKRIEALDFSYCQDLTDLGLKDLANGCGSLKTLRLFNCSGAASAGVVAIAHACGVLVHLDVAYTNVGDNALTSVVRHCKFLEKVVVTGCTRVTAKGVREAALFANVQIIR